MDLTLIGRALRRHPVLLAIGLLVALLAGFFAGYSYSSDGVQPRTPPVYSGSSTVILTNPSQSLFAAQTVPEADGADRAAAVPQDANLAQLAMVYAWVVSGDEIRTGTEAAVGELGDDELLTAQRRTTQPTGSESFGSSSALPIFDIVTRAASEERATEIAGAAQQVFLDYVTRQQDEAGIPPEQRVAVTVLRSPSAELQDGGSSAVSSALVGLVVLFVVLLLIVYRENAAQVRSARGARGAHGAVQPLAPGAAAGRRRADDPWDAEPSGAVPAGSSAG